jgi:EmrB/QacA subfamily drug resistance transporter
MNILDPRAAATAKGSHVLLVNSLSAWMTAFMTTSINIALPSIQSEFGLSAVALGWLPLGYVLASAAVLLPLGRIGDRVGRRLLFLCGTTLFALSSVAMALAGSYLPLVAFRLTQGLGAAMIFSTSMAMVTLAHPAHRRGWAMGISVAAAYLGMTTGPFIGGIIVRNLGWRSLFLVAGCFALFNLALDLGLLRRTEWKPERPEGADWIGSGIWAIALSLLLVGLSWLPLPKGLALLAAGVVGLGLFAWWETKARSPIMMIGLFRHNRVFALSNLTALVSYASIWGYTYLMSLYLQFIKGLNPQTAGVVLIIGVVLQCLFSPLAGRLSDRVDPRWLASSGLALCTLALLLFSLLGKTTPYWYIVLALCLLGVGYAFFSPPNQSSIMGSVDSQHVGFASANMSTMRMIGMAISIAAATVVISLVVGRHDIQPSDYPQLLTAIRITFGLLAGLGIVSVVASLARGKPQPGQTDGACA